MLCFHIYGSIVLQHVSLCRGELKSRQQRALASLNSWRGVDKPWQRLLVFGCSWLVVFVATTIYSRTLCRVLSKRASQRQVWINEKIIKTNLIIFNNVSDLLYNIFSILQFGLKATRVHAIVTMTITTTTTTTTTTATRLTTMNNKNIQQHHQQKQKQKQQQQQQQQQR